MLCVALAPMCRKAAARFVETVDRVLTPEELQCFWSGLDKADMSEPLRLIFRLALLTGQRRSEVAGMRKCEINHDDKVWTIPGDRIENDQTIHGRTKNRREHIVPLTGAAMHVVVKAIALSGNSEFVFPSPMCEGRVRHINGEAVSMAMRRNRKTAFGVPDMRTHDLRRTLRTFLGEEGVPDEVADRVLNHARPGVGNQHYNHAKMLPQVRRALELWAAYVAAACSERGARLTASTEAVSLDVLPGGAELGQWDVELLASG